VPNVTLTDTDVLRLADERARADRAYNDALTAVDQAVTPPPGMPGPPPAPDGHHLERLNTSWEILSTLALPAGGWKGRLAAFVWRMVGPILQRQQEFNSALVDHVNRTHARTAESREAIAKLSETLSVRLEALARFQSRLILYLQQITLYVDTKDRHEAGMLRYKLERETGGVAAGLDALGDELLKRWESAMARERRFDARVEELRGRLAAVQRVSEALQAELRRLPASTRGQGPAAAGGEGPAADGAGTIIPGGFVGVAPEGGPAERQLPETEPGSSGAERKAAGPAGTRAAALADADQSPVYAGFEDVFRGSEADIAARVSEYLPLFAGARDVLDIGCGRGEFLERLAANGVTARGVDLNGEMVRRCRERGLEAEEADALAYLASLPDASLGGLFAAQVIEHLPPDRLLRLLSLAHRKLRPGARIVLETVNPACWAAFFESYIRDITHVRPVHPETLRYLLSASGFTGVDIRFSAPYPRDGKLQRVPRSILVDAPYLSDLVEAFDGNVERLNGLFTYLDYAGIGERGQ